MVLKLEHDTFTVEYLDCVVSDDFENINAKTETSEKSHILNQMHKTVENRFLKLDKYKTHFFLIKI